jgi:hypothetical protein
MANLGSMAFLVLMGAAWIGLVAGTVFQLSQMGGALEALRTAPARQISPTAPCVALAATNHHSQ